MFNIDIYGYGYICLISVLTLCLSRVRVYFGTAFGQIPYCLSIDFAMNRSL